MAALKSFLEDAVTIDHILQDHAVPLRTRAGCEDCLSALEDRDRIKRRLRNGPGAH